MEGRLADLEHQLLLIESELFRMELQRKSRFEVRLAILNQIESLKPFVEPKKEKE